MIAESWNDTDDLIKPVGQWVAAKWEIWSWT